jgi:hypothetical protein
MECIYVRPPPPAAATRSAQSASTPSSSVGYLPGYQQLQQLRLMHQWSTFTYTSVPTTHPGHDTLWQLEAPEIAFNHDFLLHAIFALTAFEKAIPQAVDQDLSKDAQAFLDKAITSTRTSLNVIDEDTVEALVWTARLLIVLAMTAVQTSSVEDGMLVALEGLTHTLDVLVPLYAHLEKQQQSILDHPLRRPLDDTVAGPTEPLHPATAIIFRHLLILNDKARPPPSEELHGFRSVVHQGGCAKALFWLEDICTNCAILFSEPPFITTNAQALHYQEQALSWVRLIDADYMSALAAGDRVAVLMLMCWSILVQRSLGPRFWWAQGVATAIVAILENDVQWDSDGTTGWGALTKQTIDWAKGLLDMPPVA